MNAIVVLVVEDDPAVRELLSVVLRSFPGVRVVVAADGREALRRVREVRPGLILLDIHLPRLDGFEVARRLKADPRTRRIPVVAVSSVQSQEAARAGCEDHVSKPFDLALLETVVRKHLPADAEVEGSRVA